MVEQTNPGPQSAGQQKVFPVPGGLARVDSTGVQKIMLDTASAVASESVVALSNIFGGL